MRLLLVLLVGLTATLAGCADEGGDTPSDDGPDAGTGSGSAMEPAPPELTPVLVEVDLEGIYPFTIAYSPARIEVPENSIVTIRFTNTDTNLIMAHDWVLEGYLDAATEVVEVGEMSEVTFEAPPAGEYTFYCSVPGHRDNGMEGVFVVS